MIKRVFSNENILGINQSVELDLFESNYLKVLRTDKNEKVEVFAENNYGIGKIIEFKTKICKIKILSEIQYQNNVPELVIYQCIPEHKKSYLITQKLTELGTDKIVFVNSDKSSGLSVNKKNKLESVIKESVRQCKRYSIPKLEFIDFNKIDFQNSFAALLPDTKKIYNPRKLYKKSYSFLIGPESGFSENEISVLKKNQVKQYKINPNVLRTETAAIAISSVFSLFRTQPGNLGH